MIGAGWNGLTIAYGASLLNLDLTPTHSFRCGMGILNSNNPIFRNGLFRYKAGWSFYYGQ